MEYFILDSFDVTRLKKDVVKIIDFGELNESTVKATLFTYEELCNEIIEIPEFRFIAEETGIQPKSTSHVFVPQEINEFIQATNGMSMLDILRKVL